MTVPDVEENGAGKEESRSCCQHCRYFREGEDGSAEEVCHYMRLGHHEDQCFIVANVCKNMISTSPYFLSSIYKKAGLGKEKREVTYVVTKKGAGRKVRRPPGVKGTFKVVDRRMKKDLQGMQRKEHAKGRKGKGGKSKGGKGGQKSGKARKGR